MKFEKGYIYHIYNQGNNREKIFLNKENYLFFLKKIKTYITSYSDILAWCLMPNHFHLMVLVHEVSLPVSRLGVSLRHTESESHRTLNESIGIMLMGYTKAFNKQYNRTGKLFREATKAECINCPNGITPSFYKTVYGTKINSQLQGYPQVCFKYIHDNPVNAGLVKKAEDWEFSSSQDYLGIRKGTLLNKKVAKQYIEMDNLLI